MFKKIALVGLILLGIGAAVMYPKVKLYFKSRGTTINTGMVTYLLPESKDLDQIADDLIRLGVLDDKSAFLEVGAYKHLKKSRIAAGKYEIEPDVEIRTLLNGFTLNAAGNGNAEVEVVVSFNNCRDIYQMAGKISKQLAIDSNALIAKIVNQGTLDQLGFTEKQVPALFIPDSYQFFYDTNEDEFLARMAEAFKAFWNPERMQKLKAIGLKSPSQAVTLASIVYSEQSKIEKEWPIIAGLYLNRLEQGIKLQSDPTFKFCWGDELIGVQRLLAKHRAIECDYNTYQIYGLPPGPIYIPSPKVVDAVLNREKNDYIYMCARPDYSGYHNFTASGKEHERNAKLFQNWLENELKNQ